MSLLEQVVKIQEHTLAEDHSSRLTSQQLLAIIYWDLGRHDASLRMTKHVVEIQRQALDEHHPDRENSQAWLKYFENEVLKLKPT